MWSRHTLEYYSALKRKAMQTQATTRMNREDVTLSERNQEGRYCVILLVVEFTQTEHGRVVARGRGVWGGKWEVGV